MKQFQFSKIREFREALGMTQHELGEKMGLHPQQISGWENESGGGLTVRTLIKLCEVLDKKPNDFFG